ncbi:hypothetical protein [uncultured Nitrosomonas sp.]|uniref:hypothetical protein n=1 Tax=uncultured Nitrosomonas sp. TaxID=156424 RepID=UPI0025FDE732|nr:hypothetical protein [uncultured Nitrosomonas sp.]
MQPPKSAICVICGIRPATTDEHVPPKGFFKGLSGQFRTVPSCSRCNNDSSYDDEALRFYISAQLGKRTESTKLLWEKGAHKSILRSTKLRFTFLNTLQEVAAKNLNGETISHLAFLVPESLYQRVFERVTRGLYFWHRGIILPASTPVKINLLLNTPDLDDPELMLFESNSIADDAFEYKYGIDPQDSCNSLWIFGLHKSHWIKASTGLLTCDVC